MKNVKKKNTEGPIDAGQKVIRKAQASFQLRCTRRHYNNEVKNATIYQPNIAKSPMCLLDKNKTTSDTRLPNLRSLEVLDLLR